MNNQQGSPWRQPPPSQWMPQQSQQFNYDQTQQWQPSQFQPPPQPPPRLRKSKKEFTIGCGSVTPTATAVLAQCIVTHIQLKEVDI